MARTWLQIRVELIGGRDIECNPRPGRVMAVGPAHTFAEFAEAVDTAFARWDISHLHSFELADGRQIGFPGIDFDEPLWLDHDRLKVLSEVAVGEEFVYTFDLGDDWRHVCQVMPEKLDPRVEFGSAPRAPVAIWGWGWIPDQYGRESDDDEE